MQIALIVIAAIIVIAVIWWISKSNGFKKSQVKIDEALSGIEVALTKRYDMLTKLLDTAKGFAKHESELITETISLRRGMSMSELKAANDQMDAMSGRINVVAEAYPELRSSDVFKQLQIGIMDAEEHLQAARRLYNSNVSQFNSSIIMFPGSIVANSMRLTKRDFFEAEEAKKADVKMEF